MLIVLESVGSVLDTNNLCIYPQNVDGSYNKESYTPIDDEEISSEWLNALSVEDFDTVNCCM